MKNVIIAMALLISVSSMAQRGGNEHRENKSNLTPEQMATLKTKKMTLALDLSEAQQSQVQVLNLENAKARKAKMAARKSTKEKDVQNKLTSEEKFAKQNGRLDAQIAQKAEIKKILSQEQYVKWEKMAQHKGRHGKRKGEGRNKHKKEGTK